jgi:hypothetical protein
MESEARLYDFDLTRFLYANRCPLRSKTLKSLQAALIVLNIPTTVRQGSEGAIYFCFDLRPTSTSLKNRFRPPWQILMAATPIV